MIAPLRGCDSNVFARKFDKKNRLIFCSNANKLTGKNVLKTHTANFYYEKSNFVTKIDYTFYKGNTTVATSKGFNTFTYLLDVKGNWIERITYYDGKPQEIITRKIEYYP